MSKWNHAMCDNCWNAKWSDDYPPTRLRDPQRETCCWCGGSTWSGIYVREDPRWITNHQAHEDDA